MRNRIWLAGLMFVAVSVAGAQVRPGGDTTGARGRPNRPLRGLAQRGQLGDTGNVAGQAALAQQIRQRFGGVVRRQLNLDQSKWQQFDRVDKQFQRQRNQIQRDERESRLGLKAAMQDTANADQAKIAQYLNQLALAQHRRADLLDAEQKELSTFLTPLQRARLQALREQLNRRIQQLQQDQKAVGGRRGGLPE
jgi:Spy/CpxP family protein refolding chaperone